ncbi:MAG: NitT/TauT family transport system permease protein [Thermoleophilaceae bacterium]|jgi:NitT/TauT family transport system permease protein|nr:NitT/TauT family transport system permease protein [Thermoleophilaceae bacterium]
MSGRLPRFPYGVLSVLLGLVAWAAVVEVFGISPYELPAPADVLSTAFQDRSYLLSESWVTLQEMLLGFALSVIVGVVLAMLIVSLAPVEKALFPLLVAAQAVPKVAFAPLFLVWFGYGMTSKVLIAFLLSVFPVVIDTVRGLQATPVERTYLARTTGAGWWRTMVKVKIPGALPLMFAGIKLAMIFSVTGAVVGEFVGADRGLGRSMLAASASLDSAFVFAGVLYIAAMGFGLFYLVDMVERLTIGWHVSQRRRSRGPRLVQVEP